jgi:hypothetical protein
MRLEPTVPQLFAHQALSAVAFHNPGAFLSAMSEDNPNRQKVLRDLWERVRSVCPEAPGGTSPPAVFSIRPFLLCGNCGILIEMPEPKKQPEAHFVAFVVRLPHEGEPQSEAPPPAWFFTLEKGNDWLSELIPRSGFNRLLNALRSDPRRLTTLLAEPILRDALIRDLSERFSPELRNDPAFRAIFVDLLRNPESLLNDPTRFGRFLDEYDRANPTQSTVLGGWTRDRTHQNFGPGSRPDYLSFLAELAAWFSTARTRGSEPIAQTNRSPDAGN